jgi:hypothetical protein
VDFWEALTVRGQVVRQFIAGFSFAQIRQLFYSPVTFSAAELTKEKK